MDNIIILIYAITVDYNGNQIVTRTSVNDVIKEGYIVRQICGFIWQYDYSESYY